MRYNDNMMNNTNTPMTSRVSLNPNPSMNRRPLAINRQIESQAIRAARAQFRQNGGRVITCAPSNRTTKIVCWTTCSVSTRGHKRVGLGNAGFAR